MENIDEYLHKTESATRKLFEGIDSYMDILREARPPLYDPVTPQKEEGMMEFEEWHEAHQEDYASVLIAQAKFIDETFAMSCLSGAVLQLASMGIQKYSKEKRVTAGFQCVIKKPRRWRHSVSDDMYGIFPSVSLSMPVEINLIIGMKSV